MGSGRKRYGWWTGGCGRGWVWLALWLGTVPLAADEVPRFADIRPLLQKYCVDCHQGDLAQGGITLAAYQEQNAKTKDRAAWQKAQRQLQGKVMPPDDAAQPSPDERRRLLAWIEGYALTPDCSAGERPGRVTIRRLNRAEYNATVRDLFGITLQPAQDFPSDDVGYGFDNIGDVLTLPPVLLERYLDAAEKVVRAAILTPDPDSAPVRAGGGKVLASAGEAGEECDVSTTAEYIYRVRAAGDQAGPEPVKMAFRVDGQQHSVVEVPQSTNDPRDFEIRLRLTKGRHRLVVAFLNDYYMPQASDPKLRGDRNLHVLGWQLIGPIGVLPEDVPASHRRVFPRPVPAGATPAAEREQVRELLRPLVSRAFRRRVTDDELTRLLKLYAEARQSGDSIERSVQIMLQAVLVSPSFLFRVEEEAAPGKVRDLNDFELATRLSYFLWNSLPDDELFRAAAQGKLHTDEQLVAQAQRLLRDPRSQALVENFAGQWLQLRNLETFAPDRERFPEYDEALRVAIRRETELFFGHIVREDRSVLEFLDADYTFVNERLARHYGLAGVQGDEFRRVSVDRAQRGGLLGHASILAVTSNPTRTSPVKRGKWVLENLFAAPPPPAPPNVPELADGKDKTLTGTLRQRMEQHRVKPTCAACHQLMDPLGFGLENYNAIGGWRTKDGQEPIDASGELPDGRTFRGPAELKAVLLARQGEFRRCLAEKLLTFALGRGLEYYDACAVQRIAQRCGENGNRFSALITEIVKSPAFRQREGKRED
ncbi:MAG: DUF1592 domain-containing protein [Pirellulales bacterium]